MPASKKKLLTNLQKNKMFANSTPGQRRVLIARDILAHIKAGRIEATSGQWLSLDEGVLAEPKNVTKVTPQRALKNASRRNVTCQTCMIGACMYASIRRFNEVEFKDLLSKTELKKAKSGEHRLTGLGLHETQNYLKCFFTMKQMALMEFLFEEGSGMFGEDKVTQDERRAIYHFLLTNKLIQKVDDEDDEPNVNYWNYGDLGGDERNTVIMEAICKEIIRTGGKFIV